MGRKTGFIGIVLFVTIMGVLMSFKGDLLMERVSLGALIIALCMLTDNAIIVIETCKVGIERGEDKLQVIREAVAQNQWPLFGATVIGILAFAAIGLSEDASGEIMNSLFWVILISLSLSWVTSVTVTPLLSYLLFKPVSGGRGEVGDPMRASCSRFTAAFWCSPCFRYWSLLSVVRLVVASGFHEGKQSFSAGDPAAVHGRLLPPAGIHIRDSEAFAQEVQEYFKQPDVRTSPPSSAAAVYASCSYIAGAREPRSFSSGGRGRSPQD